MSSVPLLSGQTQDDKAEYIVAVRTGLLASDPSMHMTLAYLGFQTKKEIAKIASFIVDGLEPPRAFEVNFNGYAMLGEKDDIRVRDCRIPDTNAARFAFQVHEHFGVKQPWQEVRNHQQHLHVVLKTPLVEQQLANIESFTATSLFIKRVCSFVLPYDFPLKPKKQKVQQGENTVEFGTANSQ